MNKDLEKLSEELGSKVEESTIQEDLKVLNKWLKPQLKVVEDKVFFDATLGATIQRINSGKWEKQETKLEE